MTNLIAILASLLSLCVKSYLTHQGKAPVSITLRTSSLLIGVAAVALLAGCSSSATTATGSPSAHPGSTAVSSGSSKSAAISCPPSSEVNSDLGISLTGPDKKSGGGLDECDYSNQATSVDLLIAIQTVPGITLADMKTTYESQAKAAGVPYEADPSLGDGSYSLTQNDASTNASGKPTAVLGVLSGDTQLAMTGEVSLGGMETLAAQMVRK
jgi:hypothetical protein